MTEREPLGGPGGPSRDYGATAALPPVAFADFSPTELYNLTEGIADNISSVNSGLRSLEKMMKQIGGPNDNLQLRDKIHNCQQSVNGCVSATARDLQRLGVVVRRADKPQKLQLERLTQAFKDALDKYSSVQKEVSEKMAAHMPRTAPKPRPDSAAQEAADNDEAALLENQQAQARLVQFETSMLLEREAYMNKIEADVLDVGQIMADLASMVNAQGQTVDTVASHIEDAAARVEDGEKELRSGLDHQQRYRKKMFILIIIAAILAIIFIVWIVKAFR